MSEQNQAPNFKPGDSVTWTSQAGGKSKTKQGIVIIAIPANKMISEAWPEWRKWKLSHLGPFFSSRNHESYLIQVGNSKRLYWPLVKYLKPVEMEPQEESRHGNLEWILEAR